MSEHVKRILIVGGVAGGASCAARLRRLCEQCEIVVFDRGPFVSFANCGLPYFVGDVIETEDKLLVATPQLFKDRFNITVHTETEVARIDRDNRAIEVRDVATDAWQVIPLAGPANRQGRIAAAAILAATYPDRATGAMRFRGVQGTAVCGIFGLTVAMTGVSEKTLQRMGRSDYHKVYLHPGSHAGYYPGAEPIHMKVLFATADGRILGAQAVGEADVARRIDVIAMALQMGATVYDLEEAELCYAPQYGAAKDPVNLAGMIAANHLRGDLPLADWDALDATPAEIVDVRSASEYERHHMPGAKNIPLDELRSRLSELSKQQEIWLVCGVGQRAYYATRLLLQNGFHVKNLSGGMQTYGTFAATRPV